MSSAVDSTCCWDTSNPRSCALCPRFCGANRFLGQRGACGATDEVLVARAALHFWEEPPISGKDGSGTIFFSHCSVGCNYCQNVAISQRDAGRAVTCDDLVEMCLNLQEQGALNINFVTPTHYAPHIRMAVQKAKASGLGLPIVWNTGGYETVEAIKENADTVDVYLTDFKYASEESAARYSRVSDYPECALHALDEMVACAGAPVFDEYHGQERMVRGVIVRHMMLPGQLEDSKRVVRMLAERYGSSVRLSLMNQYTPVLASAAASGDTWAQVELSRCPELAAPVAPDDYAALLDFTDDLGIDEYFWQEGETCVESFIPDFEP